MSLIPESVMPHVRRFGFSGVIAAGVVVAMMLGINPITVITGRVSPPPPPTSITGVPPEGAALEALAAYPPVVGGEAELMWRRAFRFTSTKYPPIATKVVADRSEFGCGMAGKDLGTFYCTEDQTVYVDVSAYEALRRSHPRGADYAQAMLVAEAYGHHVQWALGGFDKLRSLRASASPEDVAAFEKHIDMQVACYAAMWTITAGIDELLDDSDVLAALAKVEARRDGAVVDPGGETIIPELLADASPAGRKTWYDKGYAIPAGGTCSFRKIEAEGLT